MNNRGQEGHDWSYEFLHGRFKSMQQLDWIGESTSGEWMAVEVKNQERYTDPDAHGLPHKQIYLRLKLQEGLGLRTYLLIREPDTEKVFGQWIDVLDRATDQFFSPNRRRVLYPLRHFKLLYG